MSDTQGQAEMVLTAAIARRHYLLGESKVDIANSLGISRFKVARLLETARATGMIRLEILRQGAIDPGMSSRVQEELGLHHCVVLAADEGDPDTPRHAGEAAAGLLTEIITTDDVLGLPWARSVSQMVSALAHLPRIPVIQLSGSLVIAGEETSPVDMVRRAARLAGGEAHIFFAPFILDDAASARAMRRHPQVAAALGQVTRVTVAVVGVGSWVRGGSTIYDTVSEGTRAAATEAGIVGEVAGVLFDAAGNPVRTELTDRMVTLRHQQLRTIPEVIAVAFGRGKIDAVRAAIAGGYVTSLVTDASIAHGLLA